jgi:hypothetical protein
VYFSPRSANAAVDCSSVSCANLERESSLCINCWVRRRAAVTSEAAPVITSSSVRCELLACLRRLDGVDEPDWRPEKRSSRSLSFARSALRLAASWALRNWTLDLRQKSVHTNPPSLAVVTYVFKSSVNRASRTASLAFSLFLKLSLLLAAVDPI